MIERYLTTCEQSFSVALQSNTFPFFIKDLKHLKHQHRRTLERLKTYLRSAMTTERQSGLAMMNIHYGRAIDIDEIVNIFATQHPRRLLY